MAKLKSRILRFNPSTSPDVAEHRVRIVADGTPFDYDIPHSVVDSSAPIVDGKVEVDIATLSVAPTVDGTYDVFVTAADATGNESDALEIPNALFDFSPPAAPTAGEIV